MSRPMLTEAEFAEAVEAVRNDYEQSILELIEHDRAQRAEIKRLTERHPSVACEEWHYADAAALRKINEDYIGKMRTLGDRAKRYREALMLVVPDCQRLHHAPADRHGAEPCPVEQRVRAAIKEAEGT